MAALVANYDLQSGDDKVILTTLHILNPHPSSGVSFHHHIPQSSRAASHGHLGVITRKRKADCSRCTGRDDNVQLEDTLVDGPPGREEALAGREAGVDVLKVTELRYDGPRRTRLAQDLYTANKCLQSGQQSQREQTLHGKVTEDSP